MKRIKINGRTFNIKTSMLSRLELISLAYSNGRNIKVTVSEQGEESREVLIGDTIVISPGMSITINKLKDNNDE